MGEHKAGSDLPLEVVNAEFVTRRDGRRSLLVTLVESHLSGYAETALHRKSSCAWLQAQARRRCDYSSQAFRVQCGAEGEGKTPLAPLDVRHDLRLLLWHDFELFFSQTCAPPGTGDHRCFLARG